MTDALDSLSRGDVLRAAINTGNRALVQEAPEGTLGGISPALARRLADRLGARLEPIIYPGAGKVFADAGGVVWDVGFLAIDPVRAERVSFTRPYHVIEATYAVRKDSDIADVEDVDRDGVRVLTASGSAYELHLTKSLAAAHLERSATPPDSFAEFRDGRCDAVAGVRQSLERVFSGDAAVRILPGALARVEQAMVLPRPDDPRIIALDAFVAEAIEEGFVAANLKSDSVD